MTRPLSPYSTVATLRDYILELAQNVTAAQRARSTETASSSSRVPARAWDACSRTTSSSRVPTSSASVVARPPSPTQGTSSHASMSVMTGRCGTTFLKVGRSHGAVDIVVNNAAVVVRPARADDDGIAGRGDGPHQPAGRLLCVARGRQADAEASVGTHHQHRFDAGGARAVGAADLRCHQVRLHDTDRSAGQGVRWRMASR